MGQCEGEEVAVWRAAGHNVNITSEEFRSAVKTDVERVRGPHTRVGELRWKMVANVRRRQWPAVRSSRHVRSIPKTASGGSRHCDRGGHGEIVKKPSPPHQVTFPVFTQLMEVIRSNQLGDGGPRTGPFHAVLGAEFASDQNTCDSFTNTQSVPPMRSARYLPTLIGSTVAQHVSRESMKHVATLADACVCRGRFWQCRSWTEAT